MKGFVEIGNNRFQSFFSTVFQPYPDSPIHFSAISIERVEELKKAKKKQKEKSKGKDSK